jgi:hypothetical protein
MKSAAILALSTLQTACQAFLSPPESRSLLSHHSSSFSIRKPPHTKSKSRRSIPTIPLRMSLKELATQGSIEHPQDNAHTTPQLLHALWGLISDASKNMQRGDSFTVLFPKMTSLQNGDYVSKLMAHLDACKDVCDNFGVNTVISPYMQPATTNIVGFTVKSYRNPFAAGTFNDDPTDMKFAPDPFWDDDEEWDFSLPEEEMTEEQKMLKTLPEIADRIPAEDAVVIDASKRWVDRMMADLALCPFTRSAEKSGIPLGPVRYAVDRVKSMEDAYAAYWQEVCLIEELDESDVSTTLHVLPEFCMNSVESELIGSVFS